MTLLKIATFNANSIRARLEQVLDWMAREHPHILCMQETKVQDKDFPAEAFADAGYFIVYCGQKAHAGVAIASTLEPQDVILGFDDGSDGPRLIRAKYAGIHVINSYVPQGRSPDSEHFQLKLAWFARFRAMLEAHHTPEDPLVWLGDLNVATEDIDVYNPDGLRDHVDFHPDAQAALESVRQWGFVDVFRLHHPDEPGQFTYWDYRANNPVERGIGWRIDHIWATPTLAQKSRACWIDVDARRAERPSDHTFLVAEFEL